ncbi:MAG: IS110 family transposase, partial [Alphaproteobacteria bacterium]|nr:IS110 family transposase [Alphaproteobacteria bacterium]
ELTLRNCAFDEPGHTRFYYILWQNHVIGIAVSKRTLDVCVIYDNKIRKKSFSNTESGFDKLTTWISTLGLVEPHFCLEATGYYSEPAADFLFNSGYKVSIVNPLPIKAFRTSKSICQKTDRSDAEVIARFCLQNNPRLWNPKKQNCKELREINSRLDSLKKELNRLINLLERSYTNETVKKSINEEMDFIKNQIKTLENEANQLIIRDEELQHNFEIITSIKGVGSKLAFAILADADFERFQNGRQYAAFVGVTPSHFESGTSVKDRSRISRIGSSNLRKILYMNALVVKKCNENFADTSGIKPLRLEF